MDISLLLKEHRFQDDCIDRLEAIRWKGIPTCPYCLSFNSTQIKNHKRHHCNTCNTDFSVTVGTIFHKTRVPLRTWFIAILYLTYESKPVSVRGLAIRLKVNKNTAWRITTKINQASIADKILLQNIYTFFKGPEKQEKH